MVVTGFMDYTNPNPATSCHTSSQALSHTHNYSKLPKVPSTIILNSNNSHHSYPLSSRTSTLLVATRPHHPQKHPIISKIRSYLFQPNSLPRLINNSLIPVAVVPLLTVGKKPVDNNTADREDEDEDGPQELVADGAAGLEDLD